MELPASGLKMPGHPPGEPEAISPPSHNPYHAKLEFKPLSIDDLTRYLRSETPFTYLRILHGLWEILVSVEDEAGARFESIDPATAEAVVSKRARAGGFLFEGGSMSEFVELLRKLDPPDPGVMLAVSLLGWRRGNRIDGTPRYPDRCAAMVRRLVPPGVPLYDGLLLKDAIYDGTILSLFEALRDRQLIVVGPACRAGFADFIGATRCEFLAIHGSEARKYRNETEQSLSGLLEKHATRNPVVLIQAANLAAHWALRLRSRFPTATFIDLGQVMDVCAPEDLLSKPWGKAYVGEIREFYRRFSPALVAQLPAAKPYIIRPLADPSAPVPFIENKPVDRDGVAALLGMAESANHWANFGPVNAALESQVSGDLNLPDSVSVIATSSCTASLQVAAMSVAHLLGRRSRWVVPAFAFFSTTGGIFAEGKRVDSDPDGYLSLRRLAEIPGDEYDGFVVVNLFGLNYNLKRYIDFAGQHDKFLIIDNAAGYFPSPVRRISGKVIETISFHHTKPHGFGEGGCILANSSLAPICRALANFGVGLEANDQHLGTNAKLSEVAAAYILQRLKHYQQWRFFYSSQARRIQFIGMNAGLERMIPSAQPYKVDPGQIPFLSKREISLRAIENPALTLRKYYPLCAPASLAPVAHDLYRRIVNVPCHPQVAEVPDETLFDLLASLA